MDSLSDHRTSNSNVSIPGRADIECLVNLLDVNFDLRKSLRDWWNLNRKDISIHIFPFKTNLPILGCFMGDKKVAINSNEAKMVSPEMVLFVLLHESRHSDQYDSGKYQDEYFESVFRCDIDSFRRTYLSAEMDANSYAISSMREMGFDYFLDSDEEKVRKNELVVDSVYAMMRDDIEKYEALNLMDLVFKQIL